MSKINVNTWEPETGTAATLMASGDTVTVPSGATLTVAGSFNSVGDVSIDTGNLVIGTAGKGIDFSAQTPTAATGAAATGEVLDHYEEGTWTPLPLGGSSITNATGTYVKIGNTVICRWYSGGFTGDGSAAKISGLPFSCGSVGNTHYGGCFSYHDTWSNGGQTGYVANSNSYIEITVAGSNAVATSTTGASKYIMITAIYATNT